VGRCLHADPRRRYAGAAELAGDLRLHLANLPLRGVPNRSLGERWRKWRRRQPHALARATLAALALAGILAALAVGLFHLRGRRRAAEQALAEGRGLLARDRPAEAERVLARARAELAWFPGARAMAAELDREKRRAAERRGQAELRRQRARLVRRLARLADDLRFFWDLDAPGRPALRALAARCDGLWSARALLLSGPTDEKVRRDLLDLAVLYAGLRVRLAGRGGQAPEGCVRQAVRLLDEVEARLGPSLAVDHERRRLQPGAGRGRTGAAAHRLGPLPPRQGAVARRPAPDAFWPNFYQGVCAHRLGRAAEAVEAFGACLALAPRSAPCYHNRALALEALGRRAEALRDLDRALELAPEMAVAWLERGCCTIAPGGWPGPGADFESARAHGADGASAHYNLALVCQAGGDRAGAVRHLRRALARRPDHARARALLGRLAP
jgi:tetratricopeptide (TPR) repeat protein